MTKSPNIFSYNVKGLRNFDKRRKIFNHLHHCKAHIVMLQETHSDPKVVKLWKSEWGGAMLCNHGQTNARGVAILIDRKLSHKILKTAKDTDGRVLAVKIQLENMIVTLASVYAPNRDEPIFFVNAFQLIDSLENDLQIIAGDFNTVLDINLDLVGGKGCSNRKTREFINEFMQQNNIVDIWRIQNPNRFR